MLGSALPPPGSCGVGEPGGVASGNYDGSRRYPMQERIEKAQINLLKESVVNTVCVLSDINFHEPQFPPLPLS